MKKTISILSILYILFFAFVFTACQQSAGNIITQNTYIVPIWKGSLPYAPNNPEVGWAYYNTSVKKSFIYDGSSWQIMAQDGTDGLSIIWQGELSTAPSNPQINWAYYNTIDGNSYIYNGNSWDLLAKSGRDGASGILLWLGSYSVAPNNPSDGWAYYNTTDGVSYIYYNDSWKILSKDGDSIIWKGALTSAPENPSLNWAYYNINDQTSYIWNGSQWDTLATSVGGDTIVTLGITWLGTLASAPLNPVIGNAYYNSTLGASYIYDGSSWQQISKDGINGTSSEAGYLITWKGSYSSAPSNPQAGWAYYNTSAKKSYIYDGFSWQIMAQDGTSGNTSGSGSESTPTSYLYVLIYTSQGNYIQYATQTITEVNFGQIGIGSSIRPTTFYIGINGISSSTLKLTGNPAIQISGSDADQFEIIQPSIKTVNSGKYIMDASIAFKPTSIGQKTATITIPNNSPDLPNFTFTITGKGSYYPKTIDSGEGDGQDSINKIITDSSNNVYMIGYGWELANEHSGFDWWIKKFNSIGVEQWSKVFDFYDDARGSSSSPSYDNPQYAVLDNSGNLIISSNYNTVKLSPSGSKIWELSVGGELFVDSFDNIFIGQSKYSSSGTLLWTSNVKLKPVFDSSACIYSPSGNIIEKINSDGSYNFNNLLVDSTGRYNGSVSIQQIQRIAYPVSSGKNYLLTWDDHYGTSLNEKTGYLYVSAKYASSESTIFSQTTTGYGSYAKKFNATTTDNIFVNLKTISDYSSYEGTYAIAMYESYASGSEFSSTDWISANISTAGPNTYTLEVEKGLPYVICTNDSSKGDGTKSGRITHTATYSDGTVIFSGKSSSYNSPEIFFAKETGTVTITVQTYNSSSYGTFGIVKKQLSYVQPKTSGFETGCSNIISSCIDSSNNIYVCGYEVNKVSNYSGKDIIIKKFTSDGIEISSGWNKVIDYGHCNDESPNKIIFDGTNIILIATGYDSISGSSKTDGLFYVYSTSGSLITSFEIDNWYDSSYYYCDYLGKDSFNNYYFIGYDTLLKYNSAGTLIWNIKPNISITSATLDSANNVYVAGTGNNLCTPTSSKDWYIKKYSSEGIEQ